MTLQLTSTRLRPLSVCVHGLSSRKAPAYSALLSRYPTNSPFCSRARLSHPPSFRTYVSMAHRNTAPYAAQDPREITALVHSLEAHKGKKGKGGFSVKKHTFELPNGRTVDSWKMNDWDYKKEHLPTYARGLFTYQNREGNQEIAVRGYDKFFNHGEVRKTEWENVIRDTRGPYELSVKENGCIIFVSGLDDDTLLVCSKHSTGARGDSELSHACAGEKWVEKHIATVGKKKEDLARTLRSMNATLVAELCDDDFEEHVLAYTPEQAGLYVHGINLNLPGFATYPGHLVDRFADEWGMKKVVYVMEDDINKVKKFLDQVAETGNYNGRDTEGFVIRCQAREGASGNTYVDWFFKYKFEEPYLMYRQWRECTKALISGKPPRYKKHEAITKEYLDYARKKFVQNPGLAKSYSLNHGIIKLRDEFLAFRGTTGADIIREELKNGPVEGKKATRNIVLVPVATIGCGKTTLALALVKLFGWGHYQNDNVKAKKGRGQIFADTISSLLITNPVVIADRNNHQKRERDQIITDISKTVPDARFVALHYVHDRSNYDSIRDATRKRVLDRGDNHQTIQAGSKGSGEIIEIMEGFMHRFQPVEPNDGPDALFDLIINLDPTVDSRENLEVIIGRLFETYPALFEGQEMPTDTDMDAAIEWAMNDYTPDFKMDLSRGGGNNKGAQNFNNNQIRQNMQRHENNNGRKHFQQEAKPKKAPRMEYFSVRLNNSRVGSILDALFNDKDHATSRMYNQLKQSRRVQNEFHVTLMHRASAADNQTYWDKLMKLHEACQQTAATGTWEPELGKCNVHMERVIWDDRIMCFVIRLDGSSTLQTTVEAGTSTEELVFESVNPVAHVTVGTASPNVKPKESNDLLQRWLNEGSGEQTGIGEMQVKGNVVLEGSVRGVLGRM